MDAEFDGAKAKSNKKKHGITFEEAISALRDERAIWIEDPDSHGESRWVLWGMSEHGHLLAVVITFRGNRIRIKSARKASKSEAKNYAQRI